jgi:glycosyltransferase involved in cell wall biosynthesis
VRAHPRPGDGPLVTVVISAYNRSEVLRFAVASALRQTYRRLEILVIGDACTDGSERVVASFDDPRLRWINLPENSGSQAGPHQAGLEMARGEFVAYLGQDDLWRRDHVAALVGHRQTSGAEVVATICEHVWPGRLGARRFLSSVPLALSPPSALMHDRDVALRAGGWVDYRRTVKPPDMDLTHRCIDAGARFSRVNALTVVKFASAVRPGIYRTRRNDEQERWWRRLDRRTFTLREVVSGALLLPFRPWSPFPVVRDDMWTIPGAVVTELHRIRGVGSPAAPPVTPPR